MRKMVLFLAIPFFLSAADEVDEYYTAEPVKTPEQIQQEINESELEFERAKKMFVPWYTGPLITPSPTMIPPGNLLLQPYVFVKDSYANYNSKRHSISGPSSINMNPLIAIQTGVTNNFDMLVIVQGNVNWRNNHSAGGFGDLVVSPGFLAYKQTRYAPQVKFFIQETFPTGKYQNLNPNGGGLDAVGAGSVQSQIGVIFGKVVFWQYSHPMNLRLSMGYTIPSRVTVNNFNAYGGGYGTKGIVYPGGTFGTDLGIEFSFTQRWVFALDVVYTTTGKTVFYGAPGVTAAGAPATVGSPSNDNLSLAPAFEYNWSTDLGIIAGTQFSVYGRNSGNFVSGIVSLCWVYE